MLEKNAIEVRNRNRKKTVLSTGEKTFSLVAQIVEMHGFFYGFEL